MTCVPKSVVADLFPKSVYAVVFNLTFHSFMTLQVVVLPRLIEAGVFMNRLCIVFLSQLWLICSLSRFMSLFLLRRLWLNFYPSSRYRSRSYR